MIKRKILFLVIIVLMFLNLGLVVALIYPHIKLPISEETIRFGKTQVIAKPGFPREMRFPMTRVKKCLCFGTIEYEYMIHEKKCIGLAFPCIFQKQRIPELNY